MRTENETPLLRISMHSGPEAFNTKSNLQTTPTSYNINMISLFDSQTNQENAKCYSAFPLSDADLDLEWEKIKAITWRPVRAIGCTVFFNLLTNIFSIFDTIES